MANTPKKTASKSAKIAPTKKRKQKLRIPEEDIRQVRLSFRVHDDLEKALKDAAQADGRTVSSLLTQVCIEYIMWATGEPFDRMGRRLPPGAPRGRQTLRHPEGEWMPTKPTEGGNSGS
jgi:hypothetical protein